MKRPRICAVIVSNDLEAVKGVESLVDLFEARIDLIGGGWQELVKQLNKPWIACNRCTEEGGSWQGNESERRKELLSAIELGASIIDIELVLAFANGILLVYNGYSGLKFRLSYTLLDYFTCTQVRMTVTLANY